MDYVGVKRKLVLTLSPYNYTWASRTFLDYDEAPASRHGEQTDKVAAEVHVVISKTTSFILSKPSCKNMSICHSLSRKLDESVDPS